MTSALFSVAGSVSQVAQVVAHGSTTALAIVNTAGVDTVEWSVVGPSHATTAVTITPVGKGCTATITFPADPGYDQAVLLEAKVNNGRGPTGQYDENLICRRVIGTKTHGVTVPVCSNESFERDAIVGWAKALNSLVGLLSVVPMWRRVVDIDFTQQTTQTFSADGTVTIGGIEFSVLNTGGLYAAHTHPFGVVNGTGLSIPSQASGVTMAAGLAAKTLPQICWPIPSTVNNSNRVRCAVLCGASSAASGCNSIIALTSDSSYGGYWAKYHLNAVNNTDGFNVPNTSEFGVVVAGTRTALATGKQPSFTHSVLGFEMLPGPFRPNAFGCAATVNWSAMTNLDIHVAWNAPVEMSTSNEIGVDVMGLLSQWSVCVSGALGTPAVGGRTVVKRLVIELYS